MQPSLAVDLPEMVVKAIRDAILDEFVNESALVDYFSLCICDCLT